MAKKTTSKKATKKATSEEVRTEGSEDGPVKEYKVATETKSHDDKMVERLKPVFEGNEQLARKRLYYIKKVKPAPANEEEVEFLVDRFLTGKPLTVTDDKVKGPVFEKVQQ